VYFNILLSVPKNKVWPKRMKGPLMPIRALLNISLQNFWTSNRKCDGPLESTRGLLQHNVLGSQKESLAKADETASQADSGLAHCFATKPLELNS
jgi:hypothetical protein